MKIALVGNQNSGKTTFFNLLTKQNQKTGNFPGVTVEFKEGVISQTKDLIVDLPGIYSLYPYSSEEELTTNYLLNENYDLIINIIDATNLERNLYLTLQLLDLNKPLLIALNMIDELEKRNLKLDFKELSKCINVKICPISALKNIGIKELLNNLSEPLIESDIRLNYDHLYLKIRKEIKDIIKNNNVLLPLDYVVSSIIEKRNTYSFINRNDEKRINENVKILEDYYSLEREVLITSIRYKLIDYISFKSLKKIKKESTFDLDKLLTNKYLAFPILLMILGFIFFVTFGIVNNTITGMLNQSFEELIKATRLRMTYFSLNEVVISLVCEGIMKGVFSVLSFLPTIVTLYFFLSLLEDTGYMARISFILDKPLSKIGLSGKSIVSLLIGFGCNVPSILSTRTLSSKKEKNLTLLLIPFIPCNAKMPLLTILVGAYFKLDFIIILILYIFSITIGIGGIYFINKLIKKDESKYILELPPYRLPTIKNVVIYMLEKSKDFIVKAFSIIFISSVIIWFFMNFDVNLQYTLNLEESILCKISSFITPIFNLIGVSDWKITASIISGISAKEAFVSTLSILFGSIEAAFNVITIKNVIPLVVFLLLYTPCIACISVLRKELKSTLKTLIFIGGQSLFAYLISSLIYAVMLLVF